MPMEIGNKPHPGPRAGLGSCWLPGPRLVGVPGVEEELSCRAQVT